MSLLPAGTEIGLSISVDQRTNHPMNSRSPTPGSMNSSKGAPLRVRNSPTNTALSRTPRDHRIVFSPIEPDDSRRRAKFCLHLRSWRRAREARGLDLRVDSIRSQQRHDRLAPERGGAVEIAASPEIRRRVRLVPTHARGREGLAHDVEII